MKKYYYVFILLVLLACEDPIKGDLGQPLSKIDGINGSWELVSVIQTDEQAPNKRQLDLSQYYDAFVLNFDKSNFSFFIDSTLAISGNNFFGNSGTWAFYNSQFSEYDLIYPDGLRIVNPLSDSINFTLGSPIREYDQILNLKLYRECEGEHTLSYQFIFDRK